MQDKNSKIYTVYNSCRFCGNKTLETVLHLGTMSLAGGFLYSPKDFVFEKFYPLELCFCTSCFLLQTNIVIHEDVLFKNYFYFSSKIKTLVDHFKKTAKELKKYIPGKTKNLLVEIGCNDGSFLYACLQQGWNVLGVDPAENIVQPLIQKGYPIINDYFTKKLSDKILKQYGKANVVFSSNTMAHIENMHDVLLGIKNLLKQNGILIFEVHYLGNLITDLQYDMIYHEHQYYYSLHTLQKFLVSHDMEIFDIQIIPIHA